MVKSEAPGEAASWEQVRARKRPARASVLIVLDPDAADAIDRAEGEVNAARLGLSFAVSGTDAHREAQARLDRAEWALTEAKDAARPATTEFVFEALSRPFYDELIDQHPASDEQKANAKREGRMPPNYNVDSFPPALVAATLVSPKMTLDDAKELWSDPNWSPAELVDLFAAARDVCERRRIVDLGKDSRPTGS